MSRATSPYSWQLTLQSFVHLSSRPGTRDAYVRLVCACGMCTLFWARLQAIHTPGAASSSYSVRRAVTRGVLLAGAKNLGDAGECGRICLYCAQIARCRVEESGLESPGARATEG
ncbi:hypothetical protein PENSPDRAFT_653657 [Peniophora sp. CONT]|nr:hypothetical protein PENSPDRAFT_653657 [Peniophora sp. CONT]